MIRTRIKICGLTRAEDVSSAVLAGADAVGFVFADLSPRRVKRSQARTLAQQVPAFIDRVGLFQDQDAEFVATVLDHVPLTLLQFHGREPAAYCSQFGLPYIKAISMGEENALDRAQDEFDDAAGLLLDSHLAGQPGGTGKTFDWSDIREAGMPLIIAGGLNPANVFEVVTRFRPWAVDVSSGVEESAGIKNESLIREFTAEVQRGNCQRN